jgi:hypothetical protein
MLVYIIQESVLVVKMELIFLIGIKFNLGKSQERGYR